MTGVLEFTGLPSLMFIFRVLHLDWHSATDRLGQN